MASRTTFGKMQRERKKKAKAAAKRARRHDKTELGEDEVEVEIEDSGEGQISPDELLRRVQSLQQRLEKGEITLEESEEEKAELTQRLAEIME